MRAPKEDVLTLQIVQVEFEIFCTCSLGEGEYFNWRKVKEHTSKFVIGAIFAVANINTIKQGIAFCESTEEFLQS